MILSDHSEPFTFPEAGVIQIRGILHAQDPSLLAHPSKGPVPMRTKHLTHPDHGLIGMINESVVAFLGRPISLDNLGPRAGRRLAFGLGNAHQPLG